MGSPGHIFLSYYAGDIGFAVRLAADLKNMGVNLWADRLDVRPGEGWARAVQDAVDRCAAMMVVLSPEYAAARYCRCELAAASRMRRPIFPVLLRPIPEAQWPTALKRQQPIDFSAWQQEKEYRDQLGKLVDAILQENGPAHISAVPDAEAQYLTSLLAELVEQEDSLAYATLPGEESAPGEADRPRPGLEGELLTEGLFEVWSGGGDEAAAFPLRLKFAGIREVVDAYPRFVLVGPPSSGKTAVLLHLAAEAARAYQARPGASPLPVFLRLVDWDEGASPAEFVRAHWPLQADPVQLLREGQAILFLDGLSETGPSAILARRLRAWLHGEDAPQRLVVTCRRADYWGDFLLDLPTVQAAPPDPLAIRKVMARALGEERARRALGPASPGVGMGVPDALVPPWLVRHPYLLAGFALAGMSALQEAAATSVGGLLKRLVGELWEAQRATAGVSFDELAAGLSGFAYAMIADNMPVYAPYDYACQHLGSVHLLSPENSSRFLQVENGTVRFVHHPVRNYFAALKLAGEAWQSRLARPEFDQRGTRYPQPWDEAVIILAGLAPEPDAVARQIAAVDPYLALECLIDGVSVTGHTHAHIVSQLQRAAEDAGSDGQVAAARLLAAIRHESALPMLLDAMRRGTWPLRQAATAIMREIAPPPLPGLTETLHRLDQKMRDVTAVGLRQLGESALPTLLQLIRDDDWFIRRSAAWALGEIGDKAAVPALVEALYDEENLVIADAAMALGWVRDAEALPWLRQLLHHQNWRVRKAGASALIWMGPPGIQGMLQEVGGLSSDGRRLVIEALKSTPDPTVLAALLEATVSDDVEVRGAAVEALENAEGDVVVKRLIECLADTTRPRSTRQRICDLAASILEATGRSDALAAVERWRQGTPTPPDNDSSSGETSAQRARKRLKDMTTSQRAWLALPSGAEGGGEAETQAGQAATAPTDQDIRDTADALPLVSEASDDDEEDEKARPQAARTPLAGEEALDGLIRALDETATVPDAAAPAEPEAAAEQPVPAAGPAPGALEKEGQAGRREILLELLASLHHDDWAVRQESAKALREYAELWRDTHDPPVVQRLIAALDDPDWVVRWAVAEALAWVRDRSAGEALRARLDDASWLVRVAVIRALLEINDQPSVPGIIRALSDRKDLVREAAAEALGGLGDPAAVPALIAALNDPAPSVRLAAVEAMGKLRDPAAVPALATALRQGEITIRWAAAAALGRIAVAEAVPALIAGLQDEDGPSWEDKPVCEVAAEALTGIGTAEALLAVEQWRSQHVARA